MQNPLEEKLNNNNIKPTAMRILVLQYLMEKNAAVSLKSLEASFHKADTSTLYRTLKTFEEKKLIHSIDDGTGQMKYALCLETCNCVLADQHYHFHCTVCEETFCLTSQNIPSIELPKGFSMAQANLVLKGVCAHCEVG
ncbi:MAG: Fur family transcriptional regulator [Chitinophagales bacterium]